MSTIDEALARGLAHHRAGDLRAAEQIYRQVLGEHPAHAEALHRLGALALQTGHAADAVRCSSKPSPSIPTSPNITTISARPI